MNRIFINYDIDRDSKILVDLYYKCIQSVKASKCITFKRTREAWYKEYEEKGLASVCVSVEYKGKKLAVDMLDLEFKIGFMSSIFYQDDELAIQPELHVKFLNYLEWVGVIVLED